MEFSNFSINNVMSNFQIDYTQMEIPFIQDLLNSDFLGFSQLNHNLKIVILVVIALFLINFIVKTINYAFFKLKQLFHFIYIKYKSASEKKFNTLLSKQAMSKLKEIDQFAIVCHFSVDSSLENSKLNILNEFTKAFLINQTARVKYEENDIIFRFDNYYQIVNSVITQLYLTKEIFEKRYPKLKIYMGGTNIESEENYKNLIDNVKNINKLKVSSKYLVGDSSIKLYYDLVTPQLYEFDSKGEYLIQNKTVEIYIMHPPIDRTL